ncbi:MAG: ATP-dependent zinc metalloprotease FtsH [Candidatus Limiplasma sp.]|nr:ATP-dependent zinc metalloprotease FtsH [Candidatus Limiplasma sp.]MEA5144999.1 ATP-dependent zinc metalloprotease FtsH [Candidatus Limiplasma sp.]
MMGYVVLIAAFILIAMVLNGGFGQTVDRRIEYPKLLQAIENKQVAAVAIRGSSLVGMFKESSTAAVDFPERNYDFETTIGSDFIDTVRQITATQTGKALDDVGVTDFTFTVQYRAPLVTPWYVEFLPFLIIIIISMGLWYFVIARQGGGNSKVMNFGKSHARVSDPSKNPITFKDVAGAKEEKEELQEMVDFLKNPKAYTDMGARIPKGVLLVGPPGTGKTLLAKAVAGEANAPFFSISGSDFVEMFVGVGASRVRDLFDQAKKASPAIVFIDEIDAVGRHRGAGLGGGHDEREQTLNQLLVEMDGFSTNEGVIVMAATNRRDILDPALLRPGRFDRQVTVNYPDLEGRVEILKVHSRGKPLAADVDFENIAKRMPFSTGADLENVMNEAAILAVRDKTKKIGQQNLIDAISRVQMGPEKKSHKVTPKDRKIVAYHEAGHAVVANLLPECDDVHLVTIVPRGQAGGYTLSLPAEENDNISRKALLGIITMALGGHAAEKVALDDLYTGSSSDLKRATELARRMVTQFGMSDMGTVYLSADQEVFVGMEFGQSREYSEQSAAAIDAEVKRIVDECYVRAQKILTDHSEQLTAVAEALLKLDTLSRTEFEAVMRGETLPDAPQPKPVVAEPEPEREIPTPAYQRASHALGDQEAFIEP